MLPLMFITAPDSATTFPANHIRATTCPDTPPSICRSGKDFGERVSASLNALNVANRRVEYDNSLTFGGYPLEQPA